MLYSPQIPQLKWEDPAQKLEPFPPRETKLLIAEITPLGRTYISWAEEIKFSFKTPFFIPDSHVLLVGRLLSTWVRRHKSELLLYEIHKKAGILETFYFRIVVTALTFPWLALIISIATVVGLGITAFIVRDVTRVPYKGIEVAEKFIERVPPEALAELATKATEIAEKLAEEAPKITEDIKETILKVVPPVAIGLGAIILLVIIAMIIEKRR